jgi:hypothetical protein
MTPGKVTIFTDAQTAIKRMAPEEPGPSQMYAVQARKHIAALRRARPDITIDIRWYPAHKGSRGMRRPTSGPSSRRRSRTPMGWNGYGTLIGPEHDQCRCPNFSHTPSGRSQKRNGSKPAAGLEARSPLGNKSCRVSSGQTR